MLYLTIVNSQSMGQASFPPGEELLVLLTQGAQNQEPRVVLGSGRVDRIQGWAKSWGYWERRSRDGSRNLDSGWKNWRFTACTRVDRMDYDSHLKIHKELPSGIGTGYVLRDSGGWNCGRSWVKLWNMKIAWTTSYGDEFLVTGGM